MVHLETEDGVKISDSMSLEDQQHGVYSSIPTSTTNKRMKKHNTSGSKFVTF